MTDPGELIAPLPVAWVTVADVARAIGPSVPFATDPYAPDVVDAANTAAYRKRREAGYVDDPSVSPGADVAQGVVLWAVALWRERASTDGYNSFAELGGFQPTGGSWGQIRRLLGIPRAAVDTPRAPYAAPLRGWVR